MNITTTTQYVGNDAFGNRSLTNLTSGGDNTALGADAGANLTTGNTNLFVGNAAGQHFTGGSSGNIVIGSGDWQGGAGPTASGTYSNRLYIHNAESNTPLIYGEFDNKLLKVNGQIVGTAAQDDSGAIDYSTGNLQYTTRDCGALTLNNLKSGGSYSLAIQGTDTGTCVFTAYSGSGTTGPLTVMYPPDHGATEDGSETVYTFMVMGSKVYVSWITGFTE